MELHVCKRRIALIWIIGVLILCTILFLQTLANKHEGHINEVWGWILQCTLPILSLIIGVMTLNTFQADINPIQVDKFTFNLATGLSLIYILVIGLIILLQPFTGKPLWQLSADSNLYLAPFQGIISGSVGLFY
ncbi:MAG: hypothetical protein IPP15_23160 [Saprospiraceae bacterium]|uniref:Uncharacterized protein n=1 Tax=Candidatus Opimibacter skivensis TaxID=2982028 RepID=A0A9D7SZU7_9BACT|nr:hypothetical protein [Candidatus Opimibacter skivensis]